MLYQQRNLKCRLRFDFLPAVRNEMIVFTRSEGECFCVRAEVVSVRFSVPEVKGSFAHRSALLISGLSAASFTYCGFVIDESNLLSGELISFRMALSAAEMPSSEELNQLAIETALAIT